MNQLLKRLELIKTSILLEDDEIVEFQVLKLSKMSLDDDVKSILQKLDSSNYASALTSIENYIKKYNGVVVYEDVELQGLKLELKTFEKLLQELSEKKLEYSNDMDEFNRLYSLKLGEIIKNILALKEEILAVKSSQKQEKFETLKNEYETLKTNYKDSKSKKEKLEEQLEELDEFDDAYDELYEEYEELKEEFEEEEQQLKEKRKETKQAKDELEDDETYKEYQETKQDYEEFSSEYDEIVKDSKNYFELTKDEQKELKALFRKSAKLCHPDIVIDELKEKANEIMKQLNEAYGKKDLKTIRAILNSLESGAIFSVVSDTVENKEILKEKINSLKEDIAKLSDEIKQIEEDEVFAIVKNEDLDSYFEELESQLQKEYDLLQKEKWGL